MLSHYLHIHFYLSAVAYTTLVPSTTPVFMLNANVTSFVRSEWIVFWMDLVFTTRTWGQNSVSIFHGTNPKTSWWTPVMMEPVKVLMEPIKLKLSFCVKLTGTFQLEGTVKEQQKVKNIALGTSWMACWSITGHQMHTHSQTQVLIHTNW